MNNQFDLLKKRRFLPLFLTQFLGAFNDNVYKNALIILLTFQTASYTAMSVSTLINLAGGLFIIPFFLFSATFGQYADKMEKSRLIRITKLLEITITILAAIGFFSHNLFIMMLALFLLGVQATLFGPVKYSILPQQLKSVELVGGNGLIEMGTFVAILVGTILGGVLIVIPHVGVEIVSATVFCIAVAGYFCSRFIPNAPAADPSIKINWNIVTQTCKNIKFAHGNKTVFLAILAQSWFWFYGAFMLYQTPNYAKTVLGGNEHIVTLLLAMFSLGIGAGSMLCERISKRTIEIGLVPLSAIFISILTADLFYLEPVATHARNLGLGAFFAHGAHIGLCVELFLIGIFSGLYNVPLYALIQDRSDPAHLSRIISASNIINALFMVFAAVFAIVLLKVGMTIPELFLILALLNFVVTIYICSVVPEFLLRLVVLIFVRIMYRLKINGLENLPNHGPMIVACNHISFVDAIIINSVVKQPVRFLMDNSLFNLPLLGQFSRLGKAIPIASAKEVPGLKEKAFQTAALGLRNGDIIGIFPEGSITRDGKIQPLRRGLEDLLAIQEAIVIPMALHGMWGSFFSRKYGKAMSTWPKRFRSRLVINIGEPIKAGEFKIDQLEAEMNRLYDEAT